MAWNVEYTDDFGAWWADLSEAVQDDVTSIVQLLMEYGPRLPFPHSSGIEGSKHTHMRELRVQSGGRPIRVFYAFDPRRAAILLIGGDKTGDDRFYDWVVPVADRLYDEHLAELRKEGRIDPMSSRRSFSELTRDFSPERRARIDAKVRDLKAGMALHELRQARRSTQDDLARALKVGQPAVAKLERRTDMYVSNLRRYIEALGGSLEITARFPDADVTITNFSDIEEGEAKVEKPRERG